MNRGVALAVVFGVAAFFVHHLIRAGFFKQPVPFSRLGQCVYLWGAQGAEDAAVDHERGWAFLSTNDHGNRAHKCGLRNATAGIFFIDLPSLSKAFTQEVRPELLRLVDAPADFVFHPHGISFLRVAGEDLLFAVNHNGVADAVVIFRFDSAARTLHFREAISGEGFSSLNDVAAVGARSFYFSNDLYFKHEALKSLESLLGLPLGSVWYYDGARAQRVASGFRFANGVTASADLRSLFVAASVDGAVYAYARQPDGTLREMGAARLGTGADNIVLDERGAPWVAAHPNLVQFVGHAADCAQTSASEVRSLEVTGGRDGVPFRAHSTLQLLLAADQPPPRGALPLSGSATAAPLGPYVLITPVFDSAVLLCRRQPA